MKRDFYHEYRAVSGKENAVDALRIGSWARKGASMWTVIEEPTYFARASDNDKPMIIYTAMWGSVYLIYECNKPGDAEDPAFIQAYPDIHHVHAEGTKAELWDLFIAMGRMEVSK